MSTGPDLSAARARESHIFERQAEVPARFDHKRALEIGSAGEHLVCADLLLAGYRAFQGSQGAPYDVVVDLDGRLIRLAVKSTLAPVRRPGRPGSRGIYNFGIGRSKRDIHGRTTRRAYLVSDVDVVAMVALDTRIIAYAAMRQCPTMMQFSADHGPERQTICGPKSRPMKQMGNFPFALALSILGGANA